MQSPETNQSHEPVNPPVDKDAGENNERHSEEEYTKNNLPGVEGGEARPTEEQPQPQKEDGTHPEEQRRAKKRLSWIKRYRVMFGVVSASFTIVWILTQMANMYISRRAYVGVGLEGDGKGVVSILPGNEGIEIHLRNAGQTLIRRSFVQGGILPEGILMPMEGIPTSEFPKPTLPGTPFSVVVEWNKGPEEIPRIQRGEIGMGFIVKIDYQDQFFVWHCEAVPIEYRLSAPPRFIAKPGIPICNTKIQSIRYSRKCVVPYPDRVKGEWEGVWEWFPGSHRLGPPPESNPVPCIRWSEKKP